MLPMSIVLTFIIPLLHPKNSKDWAAVKQKLSETARSIAAQDHPAWSAIVVADRSADLPALPAQFVVKRVDFPPNPVWERGDNTDAAFRDAVRLDKGRRILAGLLEAGPTGHVMIVDYDDFVSVRLAGFVADTPDAFGWYVRDGYIWDEGSAVVFRYADFSKLCGTSHVIRADLYRTPAQFEQADETYIRMWLGSHIYIREYLAEGGTPLAPLPFDGAVYRVGHPGSHSQSTALLRRLFSSREVLTRPWAVLRRLRHIRIIAGRIRREFWGVTQS
jgi:hypothetical protein